MLCTAISDTYREDEATEIHDALERVLGWGQRDWTTQGVYAYWDVDSHELLYLGLASHLPQRFAQHNALVSHSGGNKSKEIGEYFQDRERLGISVLVQSKAIAILEQVNAIDSMLGAQARDLIAVGEGQLIEMHRLVHGAKPRWNKTGGSRVGQAFATPARDLLDVLAMRRDSLFTARKPLRTVARDLQVRFFEATIHAARLRVVMEAHSVGVMPTDSAQIEEVVLQHLLFREGRIVQDLDASDDDIRRWLALLGSVEQWERDRTEQRAQFLASLGDREPTDQERALVEVLDAAVAGATADPHIRAIADILSSGYLEQRLLL